MQQCMVVGKGFLRTCKYPGGALVGVCGGAVCGVPWKQPRFRLQSDGSRSQKKIEYLLNAYGREEQMTTVYALQ
jgi:hypothetical protein